MTHKAALNLTHNSLDLRGVREFSRLFIDAGDKTGNQNDLNLGDGSLFKMPQTTAITVTGIVPRGVEGEELTIWNTGSANITFAHQSGSSAAANRFISATAADVVVTPGTAISMTYDQAASRWRINAVAGGGGGSIVGTALEMGFNLPQIDIAPDTAARLGQFTIPSGKKVTKIFLGVKRTDGGGALGAARVRVTTTNNLVSPPVVVNNVTSQQDFQEIMLGTTAPAGHAVDMTVENDLGEPTKGLVGFVVVPLEDA